MEDESVRGTCHAIWKPQFIFLLDVTNVEECESKFAALDVWISDDTSVLTKAL